MGKIWFTSDTHYWHRNIAGPGVSEWKEGYRNFADEAEMSRHLVKQINKYVNEDDILYHLGDWSFGGIQNVWNFRKQLNVKTIHLMLGNHDHHIEGNKVLPNCFALKETVGGETIFMDTENEYTRRVNAQEIFTSVNYVKTVIHDKFTFFMSHYSHRVWAGSHKGIIHLYGHSHNSLDQNWGKSMDVGMDSIYHMTTEYRPIEFSDVIKIMNKKPIQFLDHHNSKTN